MLLKVCHRLAVDLHHLQRTWLLHQILRHHTHARTYFEHRQIGIRFIHRVSDTLGDIQVSQEVLAEIFLGSYLFHGPKITKNKS